MTDYMVSANEARDLLGSGESSYWRDLGARREGAPAWGRRLVLRAAEAWGR